MQIENRIFLSTGVYARNPNSLKHEGRKPVFLYINGFSMNHTKINLFKNPALVIKKQESFALVSLGRHENMQVC